ncbi:MAG: NAD(P)/FAD-dependent oxidoreductase [Candidatus Acidiferrum sp.]|jgi:phytoene dehydrogenase-like protein
MTRKACVIGAGPNGLAAAIVLAQQGLEVEVFEAEPQPGGAAKTLELTLPGFLHDFGSAVHPLAAGSPFFSSLPLSNHGLDWIESPCPLAHPFDDGTAVTLERDLRQAQSALGQDGKAWRNLMQPFVDHWPALASEVLRPVHLLSRHPFLLARFGAVALAPATWIARSSFRDERTRALFAGLAAHSFLSLDEPLSAAFAILLGAAAHAVGWPVPRGGAQSIANALCGHLRVLGGSVKTSARVETLASPPGYDVTLCDVTPKQLLRIAAGRLSSAYKRKLGSYRYGPGVFKVDYALRSPIPWRAADCLRAATVHLGGSAAEIAASEADMRQGRLSERPFVLLAQPSLFDAARAPAGKHTAWAYCHVPHGSTSDRLEALEAQITRFAPGFGECILARRVFSPAALEEMDANLVGGDISGGAMDIGQFLFRPTRRHYATSASDLYLCSSSTPPGGGVHGMCGYHAARLALARLAR